MNNQNRAAKRTDESGEHKSLRCFISTRGIPVETYKMAEDGRKWKALAIQRKQLHRELASWANADGKHACPSLASLVRATGYSRVTVWRRVQELESLGLLVSTGKSGYQGTADYTVVTPGASIVSDSQSDTQPIVSDSIPIVSDSMPKVSDSRPIVSPRRNPTVLPLNETEGGPAAACVAYARSTYRNKFHQEQTRRDDDLSSVEGLFKTRPRN